MFDSAVSGTEKTFGDAWSLYSEIIPLHRQQFLGWIQPIDLAFFKGKRFLDAGCGIGRNSLWPLEAGAASAYAFDFDERTVAIARENLKSFPNCAVGFESIYDFKRENDFDVAFCIGVLHHLADPRKAVENLLRAVKPGGTLILWVYAYEGNESYLAWANPVRAWLTSKLHPRIVQQIARALTLLLKFYLLFPQRNRYMRFLKERSFRHMEAMVFDQLIPTISLYYRQQQVIELVEGLPVEIKHLVHSYDVSWTLVVEKHRR
jgi:SAM-dependent methyltransferase